MGEPGSAVDPLRPAAAAGGAPTGGAGAGATCGAGGMRSRVSSVQLELLLSFMEEHADFAAGKQSVYSRFSSSKLWRLLAERLNAAAHPDGARKSPDKWCRYWADIKYKARKKSAAGGALGDLSSAEERLRNILDGAGAPRGARADRGERGGSHSDDERDRKPALDRGMSGACVGVGVDEDACSDESMGACDGGGGARVSTEELLAEAAMRTALAAEKQAEAVAQGVELLRELVGVCRAALPPAPAPAPAPPPPLAPLHDHHMQQQHHHHRL